MSLSARAAPMATAARGIGLTGRPCSRPDWTIAFFFKRDVTSLWPTHEPLHDFSAVARGRLPSDPS